MKRSTRQPVPRKGLAGTDVMGVLRSYSPGQLVVRIVEEHVGWLVRSAPSIVGVWLRYLLLRATARRLGGFCWISEGCRIVNAWGLTAGKGLNMNRNAYLDARGTIEIGDHTGIGPNTVILSVDHNIVSTDPMGPAGYRPRPIRIGSGVYIGSNCFIKAGVTIGDDAVVAACSNVVTDVPAGGWVIGSPARPFSRAMRELHRNGPARGEPRRGVRSEATGDDP